MICVRKWVDFGVLLFREEVCVCSVCSFSSHLFERLSTFVSDVPHVSV